MKGFKFSKLKYTKMYVMKFKEKLPEPKTWVFRESHTHYHLNQSDKLMIRHYGSMHSHGDKEGKFIEHFI